MRPQVCWKHFGLAKHPGRCRSDSKERNRGNLGACIYLQLAQLKHLLTIGQQLIVLWQKYKDRDDDVFLWGDEVMTDIQETKGFSLAKPELIFEADGRISGCF